jgi:hypothetical protein
MKSRFRTLILTAVLVTLAGCAKNEPSGPVGATGTSISGSLAAADGRTGSLSLTSPTPPPVAGAGVPAGPSAAPGASMGIINLTGTVSLSDGTNATLTGTWDTGTGALSVTGGGFTFSGTMAGGHLSGGFTGPSITGLFSLQVSTTSSDLTVYCGTFTGRTPEALPSGGTGQGPDDGTWNLVVGATTVDAIVLSDGGDQVVLEGTRSGTSITLSVPGGTAAGTISGSSNEFVSGTYNVSGAGSGTFQGSTAMCTATTESAPIASLTINNPGISSGSTHAYLAFDSTLVFATAKDAAGHIVAAPLLTWSYTGPVRSNTAATSPGQRWFVSNGTTGSASVKVTSQNAPGVSATAIVIVQ